jgi:hypothetical protein
MPQQQQHWRQPLQLQQLEPGSRHHLWQHLGALLLQQLSNDVTGCGSTCALLL